MIGAHSNKNPFRQADCPQSLNLHKQMKRVVIIGGGELADGCQTAEGTINIKTEGCYCHTAFTKSH
jgi:hypothetical protein